VRLISKVYLDTKTIMSNMNQGNLPGIPDFTMFSPQFNKQVPNANPQSTNAQQSPVPQPSQWVPPSSTDGSNSSGQVGDGSGIGLSLANTALQGSVFGNPQQQMNQTTSGAGNMYGSAPSPMQVQLPAGMQPVPSNNYGSGYGGSSYNQGGGFNEYDDDMMDDYGGGGQGSDLVSSGAEHTGRWTRQEHELFLEALAKYGKVT
jgi:hypothetical protein